MIPYGLLVKLRFNLIVQKGSSLEGPFFNACIFGGVSSLWVERLPCTQKVIGSDPIHSTRHGYRRVATPLALGARDRKFDSYYPYHK